MMEFLRQKEKRNRGGRRGRGKTTKGATSDISHNVLSQSKAYAQRFDFVFHKNMYYGFIAKQFILERRHYFIYFF